jgi:hypothetical protein
LRRIGSAEQARAQITPTTAAANTHGPSAQPTASDGAVRTGATQRPRRPGMRPDGITRPGSLIASTWRSHQSLAAWLMPRTSGPARMIPTAVIAQLPEIMPEDTAPQAKAHSGGNHVIGLRSSSTAPGAGTEVGAEAGAQRGYAFIDAHTVN